VMAETVEWAEEPKLRSLFTPTDEDPEKSWLRVRIGSPGLYGVALGLEHPYTVLMDRASIPPDLLPTRANQRNTPNIAGLRFNVLICMKPEFKDSLWALKPEETQKNAWIMRAEFLSLEADPELGWDWTVQNFLNKWGLWEWNRGFKEAFGAVSGTQLGMLHTMMTGERTDRPDFVLVSPHLLLKQQEKYAKALLPKNRLPWLRSHPLSLDTADEFPFFRVSKSCCADAIEATITITHLEGLEFGICKRCHKSFQKETRHKKTYCSERCFNAAGVQRWREKQRRAAKKGAKRNAKG